MTRPLFPRRPVAVLAMAAVALAAPLVYAPAAGADTRTLSASGPGQIRDSTHVYDDTAALAIADLGHGDSYPAQITVAGALGVVQDVDVELSGLSHPRPSDLDLMLVGPGGQSITFLSDAGGSSPVADAALVFDDQAISYTDPVAPLVDGTAYRPGNLGDAPDDFPAPAPTAGADNALWRFNGTDPNGTWSLFVVDDTAGESGELAQGWSLVITTTANTSPDPSAVVVAGLPVGVTDVDLTLSGLSHDYPDDLDMLLTSPSGDSSVVLSDVGGDTAVSGVSLLLDDEAGADLPDDQPLTSGSYRPTDAVDPDDDPDPFPDDAGAMSVFDGTDPNGTWTLRVLDDGFGDEGRLDGWSLTIATVPLPAAPAFTTPATIRTRSVFLTGTAVPGANVRITTAGGGMWQALASPDGTWKAGLLALADGTYTFSATQSDAYRNRGAASTATVTVDRQAPQGSVVIRPGGLRPVGTSVRTSSRTVSLEITATDPSPASGIVGVRVSNDGEVFGPLQPLAARVPWTLGDHDGTRRVFIQLLDRAGNVSAAYISDTIVLDRRGPRATEVFPAARSTGVLRRVAVRAHLSEPVTAAGGLSLYRVGSTRKVRAKVTYDPATSTMTLVPRRRLDPRTRYRAELNTTVTDVAGNRLDQRPAVVGAQPRVWRFTTR